MRVSKVYVMFNPDNNRVKIGVSGSPKVRVNQLRHQSGSAIEIKYETVYIVNYSEIENKAHKHFAKHRYLGEWFNISVNDAIDYLKSADIEISEVMSLRDEGCSVREISKKIKASVGSVQSEVKSFESNENDIMFNGKSLSQLVKENKKKRKANARKPVGSDDIKGVYGGKSLSDIVAESRAKK